MNKSLIVVDCQYDFIDGSLACLNAKNAVEQIIDFMICGIASEYCCRETALDFIKAGNKVKFLGDKVAYVNKDEHENSLLEFAGEDKINIWKEKIISIEDSYLNFNEASDNKV